MMITCGWSFELTLDRATAEVYAASCNIVHHVIALWRMVTTGEAPHGVVLRPAG